MPIFKNTYQLTRYHGCRDGWQPLGSWRSKESAERLKKLADRIRPECLHRLEAV